MDSVRFGIIGMGNMGRFHAEYLLAGKVNGASLTALCTQSTHASGRYQGLTVFRTAEELYASRSIDAVIVATPHYQHAPLGIAAFEHGLHLMVEKPIAAHKADAERLIAAHGRHSHLQFGAMFQLRTEPRYLKLRRLIQSGELGTLTRINWIITDWFRTDAYYASGGWRATWKGEGGGVLLNQCLHQLDALQWLCGMPARVRGFCQLGRFHPIEVEDNVTIYLEWPNQATGVFVSSTGESPGTNRFEICGTRGKAVLENNRLLFVRNETDMTEFCRTSTSGFAKPETWNVEIPIDNAPAPHATLLQNFVDAIRQGTPLIAPGADGLHSVELANSMLFSSLLDRTLELPMDGAAFEQRLEQLVRDSRIEKRVVAIDTSDFTRSFNR